MELKNCKIGDKVMYFEYGFKFLSVGTLTNVTETNHIITDSEGKRTYWSGRMEVSFYDEDKYNALKVIMDNREKEIEEYNNRLNRVLLLEKEE